MTQKAFFDRLMIVFATLCALFGILVVRSVAQSSTPTPPISVQSLFSQDSCSPPCWFGLTPGESTLEDVIQMFQSNRDLFVVNPEPGSESYLIAENLDKLREGGKQTFLWKAWDRRVTVGTSYIEINNDIVTAMEITQNEVVTLRDTLKILGQPTKITAEGDLLLFLYLFYEDKNTVVILTSSLGECEMSTFLSDFTVAWVRYYRSNNFEIEEQEDIKSVLVPSKVWTLWQSKPESISCGTAFVEINELDLVPTLVSSPPARVTQSPPQK